MKRNLNFLRAAIKNYKVAAFTPSSRYVVAKVLRELPLHSSYVVEYGAGDGVVTAGLLDCIPEDGKVVAIELSEDFIEILTAIGDGRLKVVRGDVAVLSRRIGSLGLPRIDAVVSGIPFSFLASRQRDEVVRHTYAALQPGGRFIVYQFSPLMVPCLKRVFRKVRIVFEPRNFFPYFVMVAEK